jgi:hypothetical protein
MKTTDTAVDLFDLDTLDTRAGSDAGAEIELVHPTNGKPLGIFISVVGKHSQVFRDIVADRADERIKREADNARAGKDPEPPTAAAVEARAIEMLTACTTGWRSETKNDKGEVIKNEPVIKLKGELMPFNVANAQNVYRTFIWAREQVDAAIGNLGLFIKA